ncbi:ATP-binding protein [Fibrella aquatilis]|uniref:histidine kinase n=1 Tax=Fibrella aquatilis TaxID=2817059 RepID=A0A939JZJ7_9BACT|nr:ATP-binding protein [Fibrella aquatilis]MBO0933219.1 hypothetical protein [Fibrella aquatilis]
MRIPLLAVILFVSATVVLGQPNHAVELSVLKKALAQSPSDSAQVRLCALIAQHYFNESRLDSVYVFTKRGLRRLNKPFSPAYASDLHFFLARYYRHQGHYQQGIQPIRQAIRYAQQAHDDKRLVEYQYTLAMIYSDAGQIPEAVDQIGENLTYLISHEDGPTLASNYLLLISLFNEMNNKPMVAFYTNKYLALDKRSWPPVDRMYACLTRGEMLEKKGDLQAAAFHFKEAMYFARLTKSPNRVIETLEVLGINLCKRRQHKAAIELFRQAYKQAHALNLISFMASSKRESATAYLAMGLSGEALNQARYALQLSRQNNEANGVMASLTCLGAALEAKGSFREALAAYRENHHLKEKKFTENNTKLIAQMQARFEAENKEKAIKLLQKNVQIAQLNTLRQQEQLLVAQRTGFASAAFITLLIILMGVVYYFLRKSQQKNTLLIQQQALLQKTANELAETNAVKDKLFSLISHDLRSPIAIMKTNLREVRSANDQPQLLVPLMNRLDKQVDNVLTLLTNLLDWSMIQLKGFQSILQPTSLSTITEEVISQASELIYQKNLIIINQIDKAHVVLADKHQLRAVIRNIVANAIKFSPTGAYIRIHSVRQGETVELQIRDSGLGMSVEQLETLFGSPDVRSGTMGEKGVGLGLQICREMMDRQQGSLRISSRPNGGTTVSICLSAPTEKSPLAQESAEFNVNLPTLFNTDAA